MMQRAIVDFPQPDSPTTPSVSPRLTVKVTPSTAFTDATSFWKMIPRVTGKYFSRSSTTRSSSASRPLYRSLPRPALRASEAVAASRSFVSSSRWQRCEWSVSPVTPAQLGQLLACRSSITYGQRGWKRQPRGGLSSDGGWPGIWVSRSTSASRRGSEPSRPHVYGWCGRLKRSVDRRPPRRPAPRT